MVPSYPGPAYPQNSRAKPPPVFAIFDKVNQSEQLSVARKQAKTALLFAEHLYRSAPSPQVRSFAKAEYLAALKAFSQLVTGHPQLSDPQPTP